MNQDRRSAYEAFSIPYGRVCLKLGLTPNILTVVGLLIAAGAAVAFWQRYFFVGLALIILTSIADMLDGATARAGGLGTTFGKVFDHTLDRVGEFLILLGILLSGHVHPGWAMYALFGMWSASYTRAAAESVGGMKSCSVGFAGRLEKFVLIIAGALFEEFFPFIALQVALIVVGTISFITAAQRLWYARRELLGKGGPSA
ncbi:MAG: CDP-alcohol phosphatidyltransferase family protein [candidate division Zixibacteria bacterium]|nr:CDP-alcohol phosphatidyltransferase family protein [candidate division Zixibacteria bacterium]